MRSVLVRFVVLCCASIVGSICLAGSSAQAAFLTPEYEFTFAGSGDHQIGNARAVAIDQQTHALYVADSANHRVEKFDALGNFVLMFGDGVNQTTGGNICPEAPSDVCRSGQESSPSFPSWNNVGAIAVDNSTGASKGSVYVADLYSGGGDGSVSKFDSAGHLLTGWGEGGRKYVNAYKMSVSPYTGYLWVVDWNWQVVGYNTQGTEDVRYESYGNVVGDGDLTVDASDNVYYSGSGHPVKSEKLGREGGIVYSGAPERWAINTATGDVYMDFGGEIVVIGGDCNPALGYCAKKDSFGVGHMTGGEGFAVDASAGSVYVATDTGIAYFKSPVVPDVIPNGESPSGHTDATPTAYLDPLGAGPISQCKVEYGTTTAYGSSLPCDQSTPIEAAGAATAALSGLTPETTYHFRFVASNGNGNSIGPDQTVTPHWVKGLATGDATDIGPGTATLHGSLDPDGEATNYYFEWGKTTAYGNKAPTVGATSGSPTGIVPVETSLAGLITSETTYHYRLVGTNSIGTSRGLDRTFTTPIALLPEVRDLRASDYGLTSAVLNAEINPGFGETSYQFQYGPEIPYKSKTVVSSPIGQDGTFHPVSVAVDGLEPGRTYHFRVVALNFKGASQSQDVTFITPESPSIGSTASTPSPRSALLVAQVSGTESSGPTTVHFEYGPTTTYGSLTPESAPIVGSGAASNLVGGLRPATTYHFRAVASNSFGRAVGPDQTFVTPAEVPVPDNEPAKRCKRGFVRKKGKCVRKKPARKTHRASPRGHGERG